MDIGWNIIIGNIISLIAGVFIILSMWVNDEKQAYKYQFLNAFILIISSVFFFSWTGVVTMAIAASRNLMVYYDKLTFKWTIFFIAIYSPFFSIEAQARPRGIFFQNRKLTDSSGSHTRRTWSEH